MRRLLPVLLLLLAACGGSSGTHDAPPAAAPGGCPTSVRLTGVPASTVDTGGRLVPQEPPTSAVVCRYAPAAGGARSDLAVERPLTGGLDRLAADLQLAPAGPGAAVCADAGSAPVTPYLLRLTYPDGVVVVRADDDPAGCPGTRTDTVTSAQGRGDVLAASASAGTWTVPPLPDADQRCVPDRTGR
ncbi:MAG: hypothetical protein JWN17_1002, partial [Frankiales bacterium]|nr:hypothetical protein [Frankiales bacterium]